MISIENLSFSYRRGARALDDLSVEIGHDTITGLFGRNGSGKSTLGMLIAGLLPIRRTRGRAAGSIFIDGHPVDENPEVMPGVAYIPARVEVISGSPLAMTMDLWRMARPTWDEDFARELFELFELDPTRVIDGLSVGQRSTFSAILGLASRCPITIFDEVHLGMDAVMRELFYRVLLSDFAEHPRPSSSPPTCSRRWRTWWIPWCSCTAGNCSRPGTPMRFARATPRIASLPSPMF
ncbi:ATP-binding cassette domain-containing protein [Actinotignum sp. GS-2025e]|uniref:ATP-binding cassette domain-containing protein n=1 Tax=Actinotignum sp. GS-2025e TaxID=3427278 RepID=UPI003F47BC93